MLPAPLLQSPGRPYQPDGAGRQAKARIVLVRHAATDSTVDGILLGMSDEKLSSLGTVQAGKAAEFLMDMKVSMQFCLSRIRPLLLCFTLLQNSHDVCCSNQLVSL